MKVSFIFDLQINENAGTTLPFSGAHIQRRIEIKVREDATEEDIEVACNIEAREYFDRIVSLSVENVEIK